MCVSNLFNAYASYEQGKYLDEVAKVNAGISKKAGEDAMQRGGVAADEQRKTTQQVIGAQRAGFAANGIDVNTGTAGQIQNDAAALGELDALTIMNNAAREAYGYRVQAMDQRQQGKLAKYQGKMEAIGSILGGAEKGAMFAAGGGA
ncbi:virion core protein, T7 gp14 family [Stutzerimonas chloritidismutans]